MSADPLAEVRAELNECEIVLFADLGTGTVLAWDAAVKWPQEQLDAVCGLASAALDFGRHDGAEPATTAVLVRPTGIHLFVRATPDAAEVLCAVFAPHAALDGAAALFHELCAGLTEEGPAPSTAAGF